MYVHRYHRFKKKKRKSAFFPILMVLLILFVLKENTGLWESIKLHGKIACYQNILELYLPGAVYSAKGEVENYQTQVESELSYEDILAREAADENYVDENGKLVETGTSLQQETTEAAESQVSEETVAEQTKTQPEQMQTDTVQASVLAGEKKVVYSREKLNDFDYLLQNFYQVDNTTTINSSQLNADSLLGKDLRLSHDPSTPQILIYHTHSQEGYQDSVPGDASTTVVGVGDYLAKLLTEQHGFSVIHHTGEYDVGDRDHAYSKAGPALEQVLKENPSIEVVIDLHRDGVREDTHLVTEINGTKMAQIMFFNGLSRTTKIGDIDYLYNPYIEDNLAISFQMQLKAAEYYPGLTRRIYLKGYRYNMHYCPKSLLIEVGAQTNTVEEAMNAMVPLADILNKVLTAAQ
ncbi:MAG: stage II sporulation protein P [Clostridiales bacterium]|nr:stage II sporulation protein P [Clostridiales bacterium]